MRKLGSGCLRRCALLVAAIGTALVAGAAPADAQMCGDADGSGAVTVTDGVRALAAAAGLGGCALQTCDMNADRRLSVTDGVQVLRTAASLPAQASCSEAQVENLMLTSQGTIDIGLAPLPSGAAQGAQTTDLCPDGGSFGRDGDRVDFFGCVRGDFLYDGGLEVSEGQNGNRIVTYDVLGVGRFSTFEVVVTDGTIDITFLGGDVLVNGTLDRLSNTTGSYEEDYQDVRANADLVFVDGELAIDVDDGRGEGAFTGVAELFVLFRGPNLILADIVFLDGTEAGVFVDSGAGVCTPCASSGDCQQPLGCFECFEDCTGSVARCTVVDDDRILECADGFF